MSRDALGRYLDEGALLPAQDDFPGVRWMTRVSEPLWSGAGIRDWPDLYQPMVQLLFDVGFLGIRSHGQRVQYSYSSPGYADAFTHLEESTTFCVHPTFRRALDIV